VPNRGAGNEPTNQRTRARGTRLGCLILVGPAAQADPATELPAQACNQGTAHAATVVNANANIPVPPHGNHGCHVHLPY